jgi:hypothetical protein
VGHGIGRNLQVFTDVMPVLLAVTFYRISSTYAKPRCNYSVLSSFSDFLWKNTARFSSSGKFRVVCAIFGRVLDTTYTLD